MQDRNTAIEILNVLSLEELITEEHNKLDNDKLADIIKELSLRKHYLICLYPHRNPSVDIIKLDTVIIRSAMKGVRENFGCQIWYSKAMKN